MIGPGGDLFQVCAFCRVNGGSNSTGTWYCQMMITICQTFESGHYNKNLIVNNYQEHEQEHRSHDFLIMRLFHFCRTPLPTPQPVGSNPTPPPGKPSSQAYTQLQKCLKISCSWVCIDFQICKVTNSWKLGITARQNQASMQVIWEMGASSCSVNASGLYARWYWCINPQIHHVTDAHSWKVVREAPLNRFLRQPPLPNALQYSLTRFCIVTGQRPVLPR